MVFAAAGLDGSEKLLLLGYTNWTDPYGYCFPSEKRLADDCGTSVSTVRRAKRSLINKKLLKTVRRVSPKTGQPISNLSRINIPLLQSMARAPRSYDDNLIEITFDDDTQGDPEATLGGTPDAPEPPVETGSDLLTVQNDPYPGSDCTPPGVNMNPTPGQSEPQSLSDPEGNLSLSQEAARGGEERESGCAGETPGSDSSAVPGPRGAETADDPSGADRVVEAYAAAARVAGMLVMPDVTARVAADAAELLAAGAPVEWLAARAAEMPERRWEDLKKHVRQTRQPMTALAPAGAAKRSVVADCPDCDEGGWLLAGDDDGPPVRCAHQALTAASVGGEGR